jgi:hypothetical protein
MGFGGGGGYGGYGGGGYGGGYGGGGYAGCGYGYGGGGDGLADGGTIENITVNNDPNGPFAAVTLTDDVDNQIETVVVTAPMPSISGDLSGLDVSFAGPALDLTNMDPSQLAEQYLQTITGTNDKSNNNNYNGVGMTKDGLSHAANINTLINQITGGDPDQFRLVYDSYTGQLFVQSKSDPSNMVEIATGYSGAIGFVNQPQFEYANNLGTIPEGDWTIGQVTNNITTYDINLVPDASTDLYGRGATTFDMHGDETPSVTMNGDGSLPMASEGCIIMDQATRIAVVDSGITDLTVTADGHGYQSPNLGG